MSSAKLVFDEETLQDKMFVVKVSHVPFVTVKFVAIVGGIVSKSA